jgi:hypothetical protein
MANACPKCQSSMKRGFLLDHTYGSRAAGSWVEGEPERSIWYGVKLGGRKIMEIETWRCTKCGFLENYANTEVRHSAWS